MRDPVTSEYGPAWIEKGTVIDVDMRSWTCTVRTEYDGKDILNLHVAHPYFHTRGGEGIYAMPEVGAQVMVCHPSDNDPEFIIGFIGIPERGGSVPGDNVAEFIGDADNEAAEPENIGSDGAGGTISYMSYRGGRRRVNPGSIVLAGRDGNTMVLHRGGVVEIGSTPMCQRFFIPVMNTIRDVAENIRTTTPGGELYWTVDRQESSSGLAAGTSYRLAIRDNVNDKKASVQLTMGQVDKDNRYEVVIDPEGIDPDEGKFSVTPKYRLRISSVGNVIEDVRGSVGLTIKGSRTVKISGSDSLAVTGSRTVTAASESKTFTGDRMVKSRMSTEIASVKEIKAPIVRVGSASPAPPAMGVPVATILAELIAASLLPTPIKAKLAKLVLKVPSKTVTMGS